MWWYQERGSHAMLNCWKFLPKWCDQSMGCISKLVNIKWQLVMQIDIALNCFFFFIVANYATIKEVVMFVVLKRYKLS